MNPENASERAKENANAEIERIISDFEGWGNRSDELRSTILFFRMRASVGLANPSNDRPVSRPTTKAQVAELLDHVRNDFLGLNTPLKSLKFET